MLDENTKKLNEYDKLQENLNKIYNKIKDSFQSKDYSKDYQIAYKDSKVLFNDIEKNPIQLLDSINSFVRLTLEEKLKFISQSKFEIINIDEMMSDIQRRTGYQQVHFKTLIDNAKANIALRKEDIIYIENLKVNIMELEKEKRIIIEGCNKKFEEFKKEIKELIEKISFLEKEKSLLEEKNYELGLKINKFELQEYENRKIKLEIDQLKMNFNKEKTKIIVGKNLEINSMNKQIKHMKMIGKEKEELEKTSCFLKNKLKEEQLEISRIQTKNRMLSSRLCEANTDVDIYQNKYKRVDSLYKSTKTTLNFLINSEPIKNIKKQMKKLED